MLTMKHLRENVRKNLRLVTDHVADCVAQDMTDINRYAEDFYCGLLNTAFGYQLRNLNRDKKNYPAIDLADDENHIGVQVTSTVTRAKVTHTLKKFFDGHLDDKYHRLILLVIGKEDDFRDPFRVEREFDFDPARDIWDTPTLLDKLENIENIDTLRSVDEYLQKHLSVYRQEREKLLDLPLGSGMKAQDFVGRQEELRRIGEELAREGVAFLSGLGGMGKTELALRYGQDYRDAGRGLVYFVRFTGSLRRTVVENIAPNIPGFSRDGLNEEQIYAGAMAVLQKCDADDLLILDNADDAQESVDELRRELSKLPIRVLVTTRAEDDGAIGVGRLETETLYGIFRNHNVKISEKEMNELIAAVDGHTLTVDLMARLLRRERRTNTYKDLRDALTKKNLENADLGAVGSAYSNTEGQARINEHLKAVFRVAKLGEAERTLLRFASLLPDCGLDVEIFANAAVQKKQEKKRGFFARFFQKQEEPPLLDTKRKVLDVLQALADGGWLLWEGDTLKIHPVVCIVCREELKPIEKNCGTFLDGLWRQFDPKHYDSNRYLQLAEVFAGALELAAGPKMRATWLNRSGVLLYALADYRRAAVMYEAYLPNLARELPEHPEFATTCDNAGSVYGVLGDPKKSLEYKLQALAIREKVLPRSHPDLATSYNNVGTTYVNLGDHKKALEYQQKALEIREKVLPPEHPDLATSYNNVGMTYGYLGEPKKSLEYQEKALLAREKILPQEHPDLAQSYSNVGYSYGRLGDSVKRLEYYEKALLIREKVLPPIHPDLAQSCNNIAWAYYEMGEYDTALDYMRRSVEIAAQSLPEGHPHRMMYQNFLRRLEHEERWRREVGRNDRQNNSVTQRRERHGAVTYK